MKNYPITSESVTEGHPDKIADQISDTLLDAFIHQDADSRVAIETMVSKDNINIAGEVTSKAIVDIDKTVRDTIKEIGYTDSSFGMDYKITKIWTNIHNQSKDISRGVKKYKSKEQGAGDQGMMFGYACNETKEFMPLPIMLAHKLTKKLSTVRKLEIIKGLGPDGKSQVSVEYENDKPKRISTIVIAQQHTKDVSEKIIKNKILKKVVIPVCKNYIDKNTKILINSTGRFVIGGPEGDTGLTGRKIIVDTYGGVGRVGGGCLSGKDPSKVDRCATYMARYVAKNIVAAGLAEKCEVQLSYAIGVSKPTSIYIEYFSTNKISEEKITKLISKNFDLTPRGIIKTLKLKRPIYKKTAAYGHFGRNNSDFTWEKLDKVPTLKKL